MNPLVEHAYQTVWCNPRQDRQAVFKPARISPPTGARREVESMWDFYALPTAEHAYHVYQIGQIDPVLLGLPELAGKWVSLAEQMRSEKLIARVYTASGLMFPVSTSYVMLTDERVLLLAVRDQPRIASLRTTPVFFWVYSNAFFESDRADSREQSVQVRFIQHVSNETTIALFNDAERWIAGGGRVVLTLNGRLVWPIRWDSLKPGDLLELVYDTSIAHHLTFSINQLPAFDSTLDLKRKLLLHPDNRLPSEIWYRDDLELFITRTSEDGHKTGVYFHRNDDASLRQLTHADWSILSPQVTYQVLSHPELENIDQCSIEVFVRNSGYDHALGDEAQRLKALYRLPIDRVSGAMLGLDSTVPFWRADALEASVYPKVMGSLEGTITPRMVEDLYGYNAISRLSADSPLPLTNLEGRWAVELPYGLQADATVYEYDENGVLLGRNIHALGEVYAARRPNARLVEVISGVGGDRSGSWFGHIPYFIDPGLEHGFYATPIVDGAPDPDGWQDVTDQSGVAYHVVNDRVVWLLNHEEYFVCVRVNGQRFLAKTLTVGTTNGRLGFTITAEVSWNSDWITIPHPFPMGVLEVWLNGRALVENIDYFVKWPQVVICNKTYLNESLVQKVEYRVSGLCKPDMSRYLPEEIGFVNQGVLSRDDHHTVRDDRIIRASVGGVVVHRDRLIFDEDAVRTTERRLNGKPYALSSPPVPLSGITQSVRAMREQARANDALVWAYLTEHMPPSPASDTPNPIPERYPLVSVFTAAVLHDLRLGRLSMVDFRGQYSNMDVFNHLEDYRWLLDYDPVFKNVDSRYVAIHPHERKTVLELDLFQYNFLSRAIEVYLDGKVDLSSFVGISDALTEV